MAKKTALANITDATVSTSKAITALLSRGDDIVELLEEAQERLRQAAKELQSAEIAQKRLDECLDEIRSADASVPVTPAEAVNQ